MFILALLPLAPGHPAQDQYVTAAEAMAIHREHSRAEVPCKAPTNDTEIVVCALRSADRYRVPLVTTVRAGSEPERVEQMVTGPIGEAPCGQGAFMVHCGSVGVKTSIGSDGRVRYVRREPAP